VIEGWIYSKVSQYFDEGCDSWKELNDDESNRIETRRLFYEIGVHDAVSAARSRWYTFRRQKRKEEIHGRELGLRCSATLRRTPREGWRTRERKREVLLLRLRTWKLCRAAAMVMGMDLCRW
jgi:hypothetical protein